MNDPEVLFVGDRMYVPYAEYKALRSERGESLWRVVWNIAGTKGPRQMLEFPQEKNAMGWAAGLLKGGANGIFVTELIISKTIHVEVPPHAALPFQE